MFSRAVEREEHRGQISLACVHSDSATAGFAPAHGLCAFPVYTAQALGCSAGSCLMQALVCMPFPGLSRSGSGSRVLHKDSDLAGGRVLRPSQVRAGQVTRCLGRTVAPGWRLRLIPSPVPAARFSGCPVAPGWRLRLIPSPVPAARFSGCPVGAALVLFWGADLCLRPSWWMLTFQSPKKPWLATKPACSLVENASLGPRLPPSGSGCPRLPVSGGGWARPQPARSAQSFVL